MSEHAERLAFVRALVREAGQRSLSGFGRVEAEEKASRDGYDIATAVDHEVEAFVKERIATAWNEPVLGEEAGLEGGGPSRAAESLWVVDPIDGTFNFQHGLPLYGVSVAYCERGVPVVGAICLPASDEVYAARTGGGTFRTTGDGAGGEGDPERVRASAETRPERTLVGLGGAALAPLTAAYFARDLPRRSLRIFLCASASLAMVAAGRMNAYVQSSLNVWDCAAGDVLLREAGAPPCCDANGDPIFPARLQTLLEEGTPRKFPVVAAGNPRLRDLALDIAREALAGD